MKKTDYSIEDRLGRLSDALIDEVQNEEQIVQFVQAALDNDIDIDSIKFHLDERYGDPILARVAEDVWAESRIELGHKTSQKSKDPLQNSPMFKDEIFHYLPDILKDGAKVFQDRRQRDVFLLSATTTCASTVPNISGRYHHGELHPLFFSFIVGTSASGKSAMKYAEKLVKKVQQFKLEQSKSSLQEYERDKREYEASLKKGEDHSSPPTRPKFEVHIIPANSSISRVIQHLDANNGAGLIIESESDSLSNTIGSDWGNYSDLLRKAFGHESIRISRKTTDEYREIERPKLSICLTGTPGQVPKLIGSSEDGLFSRLSFYCFSGDPEWHDVSPEGIVTNFSQHFEELSERVLELHQHYMGRTTEFHLSQGQWSRLNKRFKQWSEEVTDIHGDNAVGLIRRLGMTCHRIAMTLTAIDYFETGHVTDMIECKNSHFDIAINMVETLLAHNLILFQSLPESTGNVFVTVDPHERFYSELPDNFPRYKAIDAGKSTGMSERTVDGLLKKWWMGNRLKKVTTGIYEKS